LYKLLPGVEYPVPACSGRQVTHARCCSCCCCRSLWDCLQGLARPAATATHSSLAAAIACCCGSLCKMLGHVQSVLVKRKRSDLQASSHNGSLDCPVELPSTSSQAECGHLGARAPPAQLMVTQSQPEQQLELQASDAISVHCSEAVLPSSSAAAAAQQHSMAPEGFESMQAMSSDEAAAPTAALRLQFPPPAQLEPAALPKIVTTFSPAPGLEPVSHSLSLTHEGPGSALDQEGPGSALDQEGPGSATHSAEAPCAALSNQDCQTSRYQSLAQQASIVGRSPGRCA
jgi:hypothetical protein